MQMILTHTKKLTLLLVFIFSLLASFSVNSVELISTSVAQGTNKENLNETQKQIFQEARKLSSEDKNTLTSILMIVAVLLVVALAMYLAFKKDGSSKKRSFARTPKKEY